MYLVLKFQIIYFSPHIENIQDLGHKMDQYKKDVQKLTEIKSQDSVQPQIINLLARTEQIHQTYQTQERKWNEQVNLLKKKFAKDIDSKEVCNIRDTFC